MKPSETSSLPFKSKKPFFHLKAQSFASGPRKTPEKSEQPPRRSRNSSVPLTMNGIRMVADSLTTRIAFAPTNQAAGQSPPEASRALVFDERTSSMKPDLHICINVDAIGNDGKLKSGSAIANMHLRKIFRARLADFSKSHPEVDEIPKEMLPESFNRLDAHSNTRNVPNLSLETPIEALGKQQLAASHLPGSFRRSFSRKVACNDGENASQNLSKTSIQALVVPVSELPLHNSSPKEETAAAPSPGELLFEPASNRESVAFSAYTACFPSSCPPATPSKEFNASARLMNVTPASHSPKRYMSPEGKSSPNKLIRLPPSRSWKFGTPGKDGIGKPHD
ncbi:CDT1-like protein b [Morella rubra]|uniref:CDT1-like protein b n=1 Tax=Morella rubra TaxID=262757 RepID=A0A6A1VLG9_9ROSI|nr:CDT1-like protein b [Morella rubra]